jgi:protein ImuA
MPPVLVARQGGRPAAPDLDLVPGPAPGGGAAFARGRVHELAGPARRTLAVMLAGRAGGPVLWIAPAWAEARLHPEGVQPFLDPGWLLFAEVPRAEDLLWTLEEALRSGAVAVAVADLPAPPGLTPVRRLQLAAEAGSALAGAAAAPLGLILTPAEGGAPGVESRWHMAPAHRPGASEWRLARTRARAQPPAAWRLARRPAGLVLLPDPSGGG